MQRTTSRRHDVPTATQPPAAGPPLGMPGRKPANWSSPPSLRWLDQLGTRGDAHTRSGKQAALSQGADLHL